MISKRLENSGNRVSPHANRNVHLYIIARKIKLSIGPRTLTWLRRDLNFWYLMLAARSRTKKTIVTHQPLYENTNIHENSRVDPMYGNR